MKKYFVCLVLGVSFFLSACKPDITKSTGWAIGWSNDNATSLSTVKILKTADGGASWTLQTSPAECTGYYGNDISAVTRHVAWAAVGGLDLEGGILHTVDGGTVWTLQPLPDGMTSRHIKSIKGLSCTRAWAVSLLGDVLRTDNGGRTWQLVPVRTAAGDVIPIAQINRLDTLGQDIWIVDVLGGAQSVIHSADNGRTWRQETLPGMEGQSSGAIVISAVNSLFVWAAMNQTGQLWWTTNGGQSWNKSSDTLAATVDYDDICASSTSVVWIAINGDGWSGGFTARVTVTDGSFESNLVHQYPYMMEGVAPMDDEKGWAVGQKMAAKEPDLPMSAIFYTENGGTTWQSQPLPADAHDVTLWKVSFVGALR